MVIELKDLQVGDEIIIPSARYLKYCKVLRPIKTKGTSASRGSIIMLYKNVYCSTRKETKEYKRTYGSKVYTWKKHEYICTPEEHNHEAYLNLNFKTIWLVKRERK